MVLPLCKEAAASIWVAQSSKVALNCMLFHKLSITAPPVILSVNRSVRFNHYPDTTYPLCVTTYQRHIEYPVVCVLSDLIQLKMSRVGIEDVHRCILCVLYFRLKSSPPNTSILCIAYGCHVILTKMVSA